MRSDIYIDGVLSKCDALKRSGLWALEPELRPRAWLDNFKQDDERLLAAIILDNLVFYSSRASDRLLIGAYYQLEDKILNGVIQTKYDPKELLERIVFTPIEGEEPNPTDSGNVLCRKIRNLLNIDEERILSPFDAVSAARTGTPVVFVDDFLGSGEQFIKTWERAYLAKAPQSFEEAFARSTFPAFCLVLVTTETALNRIRPKAPEVHVVATHILDDSYSLKSLAPPNLSPPLLEFQNAVSAFLAKHSISLNLKAHLDQNDWRLFGFHSLALLLAFEHGVPDSSVPLTWASAPAPWVRLVKPR